MLRESYLPEEFLPLKDKVNYIVQKTKTEWSSSCPSCGGVPHPDGTWPDRFLMWPVSKSGKPLGWCRNCGYAWMPDKERPPTKEEIETWRHNQIKVEERKKSEAEKAIELLKSEKLWLFYHKKLSYWARQLWEEQGIPEFWQDFYSLGFMEDYTVVNKTEQYHSPALTIPIWGKDWEVQNIKLRIIEPHNSNDRYRKVYRTGESGLFVAFPEFPISGPVVVVEGEKKAMVSAINLDAKYQILGLPSATPDELCLQVLKDCDPIILCMDPDAKVRKDKSPKSAEERLIQILGRNRCRTVDLPGKVDDLIVKSGLKLDAAIKVSRRA